MHVVWCFAEMGSGVRVVEVYLDVVVHGENGFWFEEVKIPGFLGVMVVILCGLLLSRHDHAFQQVKSHRCYVRYKFGYGSSFLIIRTMER